MGTAGVVPPAWAGFSVSIQLMSPASGDVSGWDNEQLTRYACKVSIQLMSPASGDSSL